MNVNGGDRVIVQPFPFRRPPGQSSSKRRSKKIVAELLSRVGGMEILMDYARLSRNATIRAVYSYWSMVPTCDQPDISLEKLCEIHGVAPLDLLREVALAAWEFNASVAVIITAQAMPEAVKACAKRAQQDDGVDDRRMLFQHSGFLPSPRGPAVNVYHSVRPTVAGTPLGESGLPPFERGVIAVSRALRGERD
jgi:hypothetical protein